jgi:hypothetical protein
MRGWDLWDALASLPRRRAGAVQPVPVPTSPAKPRADELLPSVVIGARSVMLEATGKRGICTVPEAMALALIRTLPNVKIVHHTTDGIAWWSVAPDYEEPDP